MAQTASLYRAFGVDFQSALALPEMREGWEGTRDPVTIARAAAPRPASAIEIDRGVVAGPATFWMEVPGIVRLLVTDGLSISVEILDDAAESEVRAFLLGSAMGALLHQRGLLPLHASAVEIHGQAVAFAGTSGAGKSTMALHLNRAGHALICDDICAVDTSGASPVVWPGLRNLKLWGETLSSAGQTVEGLEQVLQVLDKYRMPIKTLAPYRPHLLSKLFCLAKAPAHEDPSETLLGGAEAAGFLIANTFRGQLVPPMQRSSAHFAQCMDVARSTRIQRLLRPWSLDRMGDTSALIARTMFTT